MKCHGASKRGFESSFTCLGAVRLLFSEWRCKMSPNCVLFYVQPSWQTSMSVILARKAVPKKYPLLHLLEHIKILGEKKNLKSWFVVPKRP